MNTQIVCSPHNIVNVRDAEQISPLGHEVDVESNRKLGKICSHQCSAVRVYSGEQCEMRLHSFDLLKFLVEIEFLFFLRKCLHRIRFSFVVFV